MPVKKFAPAPTTLALSALLLSSMIGCAPTDPKDPKTWITKLGEGEARKRQQALQELRKLKAKQAAPDIVPLLKDPQSREDAALALGDLGGSAQVQPLIDAVDTTVGAGSDQVTRTANRTNLKIADALGSIGDPRACPTLLRLARAKDDLVRLSAVQSLGLIRCKESVGELSMMVDDASAPPLLIKKAVIALGQIGDASAIPALEHALVMEKQGVSFLSESSFALFLIGQPSVQPMIKLLTDADPTWIKWAAENKRAAAGTYAKAAIVLGDLGDKSAVPALTAKLGYTDPDPLPDTSKLLTNVVRQFSSDALGRMRVSEAAAKISALARAQDPSDEDLDNFVANALIWIGDRAQAKELLKKAQAGSIRPRVALVTGVALLGDGSLATEVDALAQKVKKGPQAECVKSALELSNGPVSDEKGACEKVAQAFIALEAPLVAAQVCVGAVATQQACWQGKLGEKSGMVRARAYYELGRLAQSASVALLIKGCSDDDLAARMAAIRALEWFLPVAAAQAELKAAAPQLATQLANEQGHIQYLKVDEELKRIQVKLARL